MLKNIIMIKREIIVCMKKHSLVLMCNCGKSGIVWKVLQIDKKVEMISTIGILPGGRWIDSPKMKMEVFSTKGDG